MNSKKLSSDEALDNATKVSTRPHSFNLYSQINDNFLAMAQASAMRIYQFLDLGEYEASITFGHETTHIGDSFCTHFKKLCFFADLLELVKTNKIKVIDHSNNVCFGSPDASVTKQWLEDSHFRDFMEASAVYSQCISIWTPIELKTCIWEDLPSYGMGTVNYYLRLQEIIDKLLSKYQGKSEKYNPDLENKVKNIIIHCVLRKIYSYTTQLDEKLKILEDLQQSEIPDWSNELQLHSFLNNVLGNWLPHPFPFVTLNNLLYFVVFMQCEPLQSLLVDFAFGMCQDLILPFGQGLFPTIFFHCENKDLSTKKIRRCYKEKVVINKAEVLRYGKAAFEQQIKSSECPELTEEYKRVILMKREVERKVMNSLVDTILSTLNTSLVAKDCANYNDCIGKNQCPLAIIFTRRLAKEWRRIFPEIIHCEREEAKIDEKFEAKTGIPPIGTL